jgi:hypothetical protein
VDGFVNPVTGNISKGRGWSVTGGFQHFWTPQIKQNVFGSYARFDYSAGAASAGIVDFNEWRLGSNVIWTPVQGLDLGVEVMYARLDPRARVFVPALGRELNWDDAWEGRVRVQRDF